LETAIEGIRNMEFVEEPNPPIRPLPGFSQSETEGMLEKVKATMKDLAENAKSKKIREEFKKELREHGWGYEEPRVEPVNTKDKTLSPHSIQLTQEQIEYLKKVALESGQDLSDF